MQVIKGSIIVHKRLALLASGAALAMLCITILRTTPAWSLDVEDASIPKLNIKIERKYRDLVLHVTVLKPNGVCILRQWNSSIRVVAYRKGARLPNRLDFEGRPRPGCEPANAYGILNQRKSLVLLYPTLGNGDRVCYLLPYVAKNRKRQLTLTKCTLV